MPNPLAGQPAPRELLTNIPRLVSAYYTGHPNSEVKRAAGRLWYLRASRQLHPGQFQ